MKTKKIVAALVVLTFAIITTTPANAVTTPPWAPAGGYQGKTTNVLLPAPKLYFYPKKKA